MLLWWEHHPRNAAAPLEVPGVSQVFVVGKLMQGTYGKVKSTSQLVCDSVKLILLEQFIFSRLSHDPLQIMVIWMHQNLPVYLFDVRYEDVPVTTPSQQYIGELR